MMFSKTHSASLALMLSVATTSVEATPPLLDYEISPRHVAVFDVASSGTTHLAVGERGVLLSSAASSPNQWQSQRLPVTESIMGLALGDNNQAVVVGQGGVILRSTDAGATWSEVDVSDFTRGDPLMDVAYLGNNQFLAVGTFGLVLQSEDGGASWHPQKISEDYFDRHLYAIVDAGQYWLLIGESGSVFSSSKTDGTWQQLSSPYQGSFFGGMETQQGAWLLYGMRGQIWRSEDKGATWHQSKTDTQVAFNANGIGQNGEIFLFGNGGLVLVSKDDGKGFAPAIRSGIAGDITSAIRLNNQWLVSSTAGIQLWNQHEGMNHDIH